MNSRFMELTSDGRGPAQKCFQMRGSKTPAPTPVTSEVLSLRTRTQSGDHHIWSNNGTFWLAFTVHCQDYTKTRIRQSLGTKDIAVARQRRDALFARYDTKASIQFQNRSQLPVYHYNVVRFRVPVRPANPPHAPAETATAI